MTPTSIVPPQKMVIALDNKKIREIDDNIPNFVNEQLLRSYTDEKVHMLNRYNESPNKIRSKDGIYVGVEDLQQTLKNSIMRSSQGDMKTISITEGSHYNAQVPELKISQKPIITLSRYQHNLQETD